MMTNLPTQLERFAAEIGSRYRFEGTIGEGGMATVYLARDLKHGRPVALKVLRPELAAAIGTDRFLAEIQTTAQLQHPHILPLYDSGEATGLLYYVMPFVEGESLRQRLDRERRLPIAEALRIGRELAFALGYAHERGVVHRDVKPENVLLSNGLSLISDFGIARVPQTTAADRRTQVGLALGTPGYMSPEQAFGEDGVDARADQYSLACLIFEMLAGELPFTGPTAESILAQRFTKSAPRVSSKREGVPAGVDLALHRALARDAADRFPSMVAFAEALVTGAPATAALDKSIAVLPFANMSGPDDEFFADGITEEIINALAQLDGLKVAARTSSFAFKGRQGNLREVGDRLGVTTVLEGSVRRAGPRLRVTVQLIQVGDGYHLWSERYDRELTDVFAIQDEIAGAIAAKLKVTLAGQEGGRLVKAPTANLEAYDLFLRGRVLQSQRGGSVLASLACFARAVALDPTFAEALAWLGDAHRLLCVYGLRSAAETMPMARDLANRAVLIDPKMAEAHATLAGVSLVFDRDFGRALAAWDRALELNPLHVRARAERALWYYAAVAGDSEQAISEAARATEVDPLSAWAASIHTLTLGFAGRFGQALAEAQRAATLDPGSFLARWVVMEATMWQGDHAGAIALSEPVLLMSGRHPWAMTTLGIAMAKLGRIDQASALYQELIARSATSYVGAFWLAALAGALGRIDEALAAGARAVRELDPFMMLGRRLPDWAPLRADPRCDQLLGKVGL